MPLIEIPDALYNRLQVFVPVVRAVLDEDADIGDALNIVVEAGLRASLNAIIEGQDKDVLIQAIDQLAAADPNLVYGHTATMIGLGADLQVQRSDEPDEN